MLTYSWIFFYFSFLFDLALVEAVNSVHLLVQISPPEDVQPLSQRSGGRSNAPLMFQTGERFKSVLLG